MIRRLLEYDRRLSALESDFRQFSADFLMVADELETAGLIESFSSLEQFRIHMNSLGDFVQFMADQYNSKEDKR